MWHVYFGWLTSTIIPCVKLHLTPVGYLQSFGRWLVSAIEVDVQPVLNDACDNVSIVNLAVGTFCYNVALRNDMNLPHPDEPLFGVF
jgi:hypothetical protein